MNIVTFLSSFLTSSAHCPTRVVIAAGQCLNTLTDDNKDIYIEFQNHPEYTTTLLNLINDSSNTLVQVLACAILLNVREVVNISSTWDEDNDTLGELNKVFPSLQSTIISMETITPLITFRALVFLFIPKLHLVTPLPYLSSE
ncbi:hypothetical protein RMATCC62417_12778 [Rhizopus microsporus]|nr:hypothetical protein RMATCC62417_12778 [Rhizopus microsporus]